MNLIYELKRNGLNIKNLGDSDRGELQTFVSLFQDFFLLCEGQEGSAEGILRYCPPTKDPLKDKFVLGFYEDERLMGVIDLIQNYPENGVWTIGYLLIHPEFRSLKWGQNIIENLAITVRKFEGKKLRCSVQKQNPRALNFWKKCGFDIVDTITELLGFSENETDVLERKL